MIIKDGIVLNKFSQVVHRNKLGSSEDIFHVKAGADIRSGCKLSQGRNSCREIRIFFAFRARFMRKALLER